MQNTNFTCPTCRSDLTNNHFSDTRIHRKIKSLQVYCNNKYDGCQWKGDLKNIEDHLQECLYQLVSCSNDCGKNLQRRHLQNHLTDSCPRRLVLCQYCFKKGQHQLITGGHRGVCSAYPIKCTNEECYKNVPRKLMPSHKASCPKEMISCGYRSVGCEEKMKREEQEEHNEQWREQHLHFAAGEISKLKATNEKLQIELKTFKTTTESLQAELKTSKEKLQNTVYTIITANREMKMKFSGFANKKVCNTRWYSPGFYTSPEGYKMCLHVDANGTGNGKGTHVSCFIHLMSGEYDDILEWPFQGEVTIELLNQLENKNHHKMVVCFSESASQYKSRVIGRERAENGWGYHQFISHTQLHSLINYCQYLKDDTLYFRVSAEVTSNTKPWLAPITKIPRLE